MRREREKIQTLEEFEMELKKKNFMSFNKKTRKKLNLIFSSNSFLRQNYF
jgi:hypothetical protein